MILGIDTSGHNLGLALGHGGLIVAARLSKPGLKHGEILQENIAKFLETTGISLADLQGIAITLGPGSFTGLRIGLAAAKGYAHALDIPLAGISTLRAAAYAFKNYEKRVVVAYDAKRNEIYWNIFDCRGAEPQPLAADSIGPIQQLNSLISPDVIFFGPELLKEKISSLLGVEEYLSNDDFNLAAPAAIAGERDISQNQQLEKATVVPVYLRY